MVRSIIGPGSKNVLLYMDHMFHADKEYNIQIKGDCHYGKEVIFWVPNELD